MAAARQFSTAARQPASIFVAIEESPILYEGVHGTLLQMNSDNPRSNPGQEVGLQEVSPGRLGAGPGSTVEVDYRDKLSPRGP
jgi:hypothetical protein